MDSFQDVRQFLRKKRLFPCLALMAIFILPQICRSQEQSDTDCLALLLNRCEECHYITRVCQKLKTKSKRSWKRSLKVMVKRGLKVTPGETKTLVKCLSEPAPEVIEYCEK